MRRLLRLACGAAGLAAIVLTFAWAAPASATTSDGEIGLELRSVAPTFRPGEAIGLTFAVTNTSGQVCGLTRVTDGVVQVLSVRRDGVEVIPQHGYSRYEDGLHAAIAAGMVAAEPGSIVEAGLHSLQVAETDDAQSWVLRSVVATSSGVGLDTLWPVGAPGRYEVTARYAVLPVDGPVAPCAGAAAATVAFTVGDVSAGGGGHIWIWLAAGVLLALVLAVVVTVYVLRRRGRRPGAVTAAILLVVGIAAVIGLPAKPAAAIIIVSPHGGEPVPGVDFTGAVNDCLAIFTSPGGDPTGIMDRLRAPGSPPVRIVPVTGGSNTFATPDSPAGAGSSVITWNPTSTDPFHDGVARDPCAALYHELVHADDIARDAAPEGMCGSTGIPTAEVRATFEENRYRASRGLPPRTSYQGNPLPASLDECDEPTPPERPERGPRRICAGEDSTECARTSGDPHLVTFDRAYYDFQAVGEFVLVRSTAGERLEVQARQSPYGRGREVSVNSAVAFGIGDHRVSMTLVDGVTVLHIDGEPAVLPRGETALPGGGTITRRDSDIGAADGYDIAWPDGSAAAVDHTDIAYRLLVHLDERRAGAVEGLLGDFDGDPTNDLPAAPVTFDDLYPSFADSWRVSDSLFTYGDSESTETFTDRSYPDRPLAIDDLEAAAREQAELACRLAGVTDPWLLAECAFDIAVTGRLDFAVATAGTQSIAAPAGAPIAAEARAEGAVSPDGEQRLTFEGRAGESVFIDVVAPTLPSRCSPMRLLDPSGEVIASGCITGGAGTIDRMELELDGEYTFLIEGYEGVRGRALVRVFAVADIAGTIEPNGAEVSAVLTQPGSAAHYEFTGSAGQRVYVAARGLPTQCSPLRLLDAAGRTLASGCTVNGRGQLDDLVLPADGDYTLVVDPVDRTLATAHVRLFVSEDRTGSITVGGPPMEATIDTPGAIAAFEFTGTAGLAVAVQVTGATLPAGCSPLRLLDSGGRTLGAGCLLGGEGVVEAVLPADGAYRIVVDPSGAATGSLTVTLREG